MSVHRAVAKRHGKGGPPNAHVSLALSPQAASGVPFHSLLIQMIDGVSTSEAGKQTVEALTPRWGPGKKVVVATKSMHPADP